MEKDHLERSFYSQLHPALTRVSNVWRVLLAIRTACLVLLRKDWIIADVATGATIGITSVPQGMDAGNVFFFFVLTAFLCLHVVIFNLSETVTQEYHLALFPLKAWHTHCWPICLESMVISQLSSLRSFVLLTLLTLFFVN